MRGKGVGVPRDIVRRCWASLMDSHQGLMAVVMDVAGVGDAWECTYKAGTCKSPHIWGKS